MPIYYDLYQSPTRDDSKQVKQHARAKSIGTLSTEELADRIVRRSSLDRAEVMLVLSRTVDELKIALAQGFRVHISELGYFAPRLTAIQSADRRHKHPVVRAVGLQFAQEKDVKRYFLSIDTLPLEGMSRAVHNVNEEEIDAVLRTHFKTEPTITRSRLQSIYPTVSRTSLCAYLKSCVEQGKLRNVGTRNAPVYMKGDAL